MTYFYILIRQIFGMGVMAFLLILWILRELFYIFYSSISKTSR